MKRRHVLAGALSAFLLIAAGPALVGQSVAPSRTPPEMDDADGEETIVLSPFTVEGSEDKDAYAAKATLAGTRIRTELKDIGASVSAITKQFLEDTNSTSVTSLLVYTPNSEVAGQGGNFLGRGDGAILTGTFDQEPISRTRIRGLSDADNTRDFYLSDIPWDSYNIGRIDMQRGPNSVLFGIGSPAGIVNASLSGATFTDSNKLEYQFGSYNTTRATADLNKVLLPNELAVRVAVLRDDTKFRQDPAYRDDHRVFFAGRWDPSVLNKGSSHTSLRVNYEKGNIDSNLPRNTPPLDAISLWFSDLNKQLFDNRGQAGLQFRESPAGDRLSNLSVLAPFLINNASGQQEGAFWPVERPGVDFYMIGPSTFNEYAQRARLPYQNIGGYKATSLTDPTIFDFYNNLLEGPNKHEFNDFEAYNIALSQTFMDDKLGFELAYDDQDVRWGNTSFLGGDSASITVDLMLYRPHDPLPPAVNPPNPPLVRNPYAGRPLVGSGGGGGFWHERTREVLRGTGFAELDFNDIAGKESALGRILGRNVFTAVAIDDERYNLKGNFRNFVVGDSATIAGTSGFSQSVYLINYLGLQIPAGQTSPAGLNLTGIKGRITPTSTTILVNPAGSTAANPLPPITVGLPIISNQDLTDNAKEYSSGTKLVEKVSSTAGVWQGYWFDGLLVPMVGMRRDEQTVHNAGTPPPRSLNGRIIADLNSPAWFTPNNDSEITAAARGRGSEINRTSVTSKTYSLVTHIPESWRDNLPGQMDISLFYNKSENIKPEAGRRDLMGDALPNPAGETKEYGIAFRGFNDRVSIRLARYETAATDVRVADNIPAGYILGVVDAGWGQNRAWHYRNYPGDLGQYFGEDYRYRYGWGGTVFGYSSDGHAVTFRPAGPAQGQTILEPDAATGRNRRIYNYNYTQAELDETWAKQKAATDAWFANPLPDKMIEFWGLTDYGTGPTLGLTSDASLLSGNFIPRHDVGGFVVTGDTQSEGYELEIIANPVDGLNVSLNVSKTEATRTNLAKSFVDWVEYRYDIIKNTPAGDIRMWGGGGDSQDVDPFHFDGWTVERYWDRQFMPEYNLFRALEGADAPELQPWAVNVVSTYTFQEGTLRGVMVGGGYRWASANIVGFPGKTVNGVDSFDISKPYKGAEESALDLWLGYSRKINDRFRWSIQLNVRNVFANDELIPVTRHVDGTGAAYRIPEPRTWTLRNTLEF